MRGNGGYLDRQVVRSNGFYHAIPRIVFVTDGSVSKYRRTDDANQFVTVSYDFLVWQFPPAFGNFNIHKVKLAEMTARL